MTVAVAIETSGGGGAGAAAGRGLGAGPARSVNAGFLAVLHSGMPSGVTAGAPAGSGSFQASWREQMAALGGSLDESPASEAADPSLAGPLPPGMSQRGVKAAAAPPSTKAGAAKPEPAKPAPPPAAWLPSAGPSSSVLSGLRAQIPSAPLTAAATSAGTAEKRSTVVGETTSQNKSDQSRRPVAERSAAAAVISGTAAHAPVQVASPIVPAVVQPLQMQPLQSAAQETDSSSGSGPSQRITTPADFAPGDSVLPTVSNAGPATAGASAPPVAKVPANDPALVEQDFDAPAGFGASAITPIGAMDMGLPRADAGARADAGEGAAQTASSATRVASPTPDLDAPAVQPVGLHAADQAASPPMAGEGTRVSGKTEGKPAIAAAEVHSSPAAATVRLPHLAAPAAQEAAQPEEAASSRFGSVDPPSEPKVAPSAHALPLATAANGRSQSPPIAPESSPATQAGSASPAADANPVTSAAATPEALAGAAAAARPAQKSLHTSSSATQPGTVLAGVAFQPGGFSSGADAAVLSRDGAAPHAATAAAAASASAANQPGSDPFQSLDSEAAPGAPTWTHAASHQAEAGFQDPSLGWIGVRADLSGGAVHASLMPGSAQAAQELGKHVDGLNTYLAEQRTPVETLGVAAPLTKSPSDLGFGQGMQQGGGQQHAGQGAQPGSGSETGQDASQNLVRNADGNASLPLPLRAAAVQSAAIGPAQGASETSPTAAEGRGTHISLVA